MIDGLEGKRLVVCVGPGGVGKTTLAAALALGAAREGRRVVVITIDPARRLADALGLDGLHDALRPVAGIEGGGSLDAAMLDTRQSYRALIERITADPEARARILSNRVFRGFSRTLARSHAYIAMERLHDVLERGEHDLVVLDTPPTRSALDILDAPGRLVRFLDERVLDAFVGEGGGGARAWLRNKGAAVALRLFGAMVGETLMEELGGFFEVFLHLRGGFAQRADSVMRELRAETTAFALVTAPELTPLADASYLRDGLLERGAPIGAVLFNRAFVSDEVGAPLAPARPYVIESAPAEVQGVLRAARAVRASVDAADIRRSDAIAGFVERLGAESRVARFPRLDREPTSLEALLALLDARR